MLSASDILRVLYLADPIAVAEPMIRRDAGLMRNGRQSGEGETAAALRRLDALGFAWHSIDPLTGDTTWRLTAAGRAQARMQDGLPATTS